MEKRRQRKWVVAQCRYIGIDFAGGGNHGCVMAVRIALVGDVITEKTRKKYVM